MMQKPEEKKKKHNWEGNEAEKNGKWKNGEEETAIIRHWMSSTRNCAVEKSVNTVLDNLHREVVDNTITVTWLSESGVILVFSSASTVTLRHRGVKNVVDIILYHSNVVPR